MSDELEAARERVRLASESERCTALERFVEIVLARHAWTIFDEAERAAEELVSITHAESEAHARAQLLLGRVRLAQPVKRGDAVTPLTEAARRFDALLGARAPATGRAYERLAAAFAQHSSWEAAAEAIERAIAALRASSDDATLRALLFSFATALENMGRSDEALRALDEMTGESAAFLAARGRSLVSVGRLDDARDIALTLARQSLRDAFEIEARRCHALGDRTNALAFHDAYAILRGELDLALLAPIGPGAASALARLEIDAARYAFRADRFEFEVVSPTRIPIDIAFAEDAALGPIVERLFSHANVHHGRNENDYGSGWDEQVWLVEGVNAAFSDLPDDERPAGMPARAWIAERGGIRPSSSAELRARFPR